MLPGHSCGPIDPTAAKWQLFRHVCTGKLDPLGLEAAAKSVLKIDEALALISDGSRERGQPWESPGDYQLDTF